MKYISIRDVAEKAGVSTSAVSRVLNSKKGMVSQVMNDKVIKACEELDYKLNPSIQDMVRKGRNGHTHNLAFVLVGHDFSDPAYSGLLDGIAKGIGDFDYNLVLVHLSGKEKNFYALPPVLRDGRVDGIFITGDLNLEIISIIKKTEKPHVIFGNYDEQISGNSVCIEVNLKLRVARMVAELKKSGKKNIAYFTESHHGYYQSENIEAFKKALKDNDLAVNENIIYCGNGLLSGAINFMKPILLFKEVLFDAIICFNFRCATEISHLIFARSVSDNSLPILLATIRPYSHYKLPIFALYGDGISEKIAYKGLKCIIEMIETSDLTPYKIGLISNFVAE